MSKKRWMMIICIIAIIICGLATRTSYAYDILPSWLAKGAGDALWATMFYLIFLWVKPNASIRFQCGITIVFAWCIEVTQILQMEWLMQLRKTPLRYVFGQGFHVEDLLFYVIGTFIGASIHYMLYNKDK